MIYFLQAADHGAACQQSDIVLTCYREVEPTIRGRDPTRWRTYRVGDDGSVWSKTSSGEWRRLNAVTSSYGYLCVYLGAGNVNRRLVHRLVLEAFRGPGPDGFECRHLNGDPADNRLENLAWGSHLTNMDDRSLHGRTCQGENSGTAKLTGGIVLEIVKRYQAGGSSQRAIASAFGVSKAAVFDVLSGRRWASASGIKPTKPARKGEK